MANVLSVKQQFASFSAGAHTPFVTVAFCAHTVTVTPPRGDPVGEKVIEFTAPPCACVEIGKAKTSRHTNATKM